MAQGHPRDIAEADLFAARLHGRLDAEAFHRRLRERERRERDDRLTRLASGADDAIVDTLAPRHASADVLRLEREVDRLATFHQAVLRSRAWTVIQALRRLFGRAW